MCGYAFVLTFIIVSHQV